jgi:PhnB protein
MSNSVKPIPDGYSVVAPYLIIRGAARALEFYKQALGAVERLRLDMPGGKIGHAEIQFGPSLIMLADEMPEMGYRSPEAFGGSPVSLHLYVEDTDAVVARAVAHGAKLLRPVQNQFYGDRSGTFSDPFGHIWTVATHVEDVTHEEIQRRAAQMHGGNS